MKIERNAFSMSTGILFLISCDIHFGCECILYLVFLLYFLFFFFSLQIANNLLLQSLFSQYRWNISIINTLGIFAQFSSFLNKIDCGSQFSFLYNNFSPIHPQIQHFPFLMEINKYFAFYIQHIF